MTFKKIRSKFRNFFLRREEQARFEGFIAGVQYGQYVAKKDAKNV